MSLILWGIAILLAYWLIDNIRCLRRNIILAKQSGIPYIVIPVSVLNVAWQLQSWIWTPLIHKLPRKWIFPWAFLSSHEWVHQLGREPFEYLNSNVILVVSPKLIVCYVADPEAITQITTRRGDFPKYVKIYSSLDLYGKNVVTTEGQVWRHHRKIASPPFAEKNNLLVWSESLHQAQAMLNEWIRPGETSSKPTLGVGEATMQLSLNVISGAGFGVRLYWPHEEHSEKGGVDAVPPGHTMTYKHALTALLENVIQVLLLPKWFAKRSPISSNRLAYRALNEWGQYMQEMFDEKKSQVASGQLADGMDLMGALVRGAGIDPSSKSSGQLLADDEILGNAFVFILAGHETTANTLHFSLLQLAMNPGTQRRLQADLDATLGSRPMSQWSYEEDLPKLASGMPGAVMAEELRLWPPAPNIPKSTVTPQPLTLGGRRVTVPAGALVNLDCIALHLDPASFPVAPGADPKTDLARFRPERWLGSGKAKTSGPEHEDLAPGLFRPRRGAYVPFSDGARSCIGRRFAQVEVLAALAAVFKEYSVELAVEEILHGEKWPYKPGSGDEVVEMPAVKEGEKRAAWMEARGRAEGLFRDKMATMITLQMKGARLPVRFVRRGNERFLYDD